MLKKFCILILFSILITIGTQSQTLAEKRKPRYVKPIPKKNISAIKKAVLIKRQRANGDLNRDGLVNHKDRIIRNRILTQRNFVGTYDLNGDGVINYKDKIKWVNTHSTLPSTILINKQDNESLEDIDMNADGNIDQTDIDIWFQNYDLDGNGQISEDEFSSQ